MTLNEWIAQYCEDNSIELPEDITDNETAIDFLMLNNSGGGGGGSSDIEMVNVHVVKSGSFDVEFYGALCIFDDLAEEPPYYYSNDMVNMRSSVNELNLSLVTYKGLASLGINPLTSGKTVTVSGNITHNVNYYYYVTGDAEVSIS